MEISNQEKGSKICLLLFFISSSCNYTNAKYRLEYSELANSAFDTSLYEKSLDAAECERQLSHIWSDLSLRLQFIDAGLRVPKFIAQGNNLDSGNYHGCLGIHHAVDNSTIQGKYCMINVPAYQDSGLPRLPESPGFFEIPNEIIHNGLLSEEVKMLNKSSNKNKEMIDKIRMLIETNVEISEVLKLVGENSTSLDNFRMGVCIPKPCTVSEGFKGLFNSVTKRSFQYQEEFCRLPNDKPWAPADYVAIVVFSLIGILTVVSTLYDLYIQFVLYRDPKSLNPLYTAFSVYTNTRRLTTFTKNRDALECLDGIRALSMAWILVLHVFEDLQPVFNVTEYQDFLLSTHSIWFTSAYLAVDTFFMLSGMLLVYTNAGKLTGSKLIRNLHLFYLNRIQRLFPLLAVSILMQASFLHWTSDGPLWQRMAFETDVCRKYWWLNLLFVHNFFKPTCLRVSWYLAVDMQLHLVSPVLLYFVLSRSRRRAWAALAGGLLTTLTASTVYVFIKPSPASMIHYWRIKENTAFMDNYYFKTLPRAPQFFVGMIFGYILYLCRQHKPKFSKTTVFLLWCLIIAMGSLSFCSPEPTKNVNHNNQTMNNLINAFARPLWAFAVACLIVVCVNGYGGPVNWFLSLQLWKPISRISYAMYLLHFPLFLVIIGSFVQPVYFSVYGTLNASICVFLISFVVGFIATVVIELPFSTIFKHSMGRDPNKPQKKNGVKLAEKVN